MVIKSTIPVGYIESVRQRFNTNKIVFSPESLWEGQALYHNLYPSRVILGEQSECDRKFTDLLVQRAIKEDVPVFFTNSTEAEAIKLFANTYLAVRVSFFNGVDSYLEVKGLNA